jgi:hypothetical protein
MGVNMGVQRLSAAPEADTAPVLDSAGRDRPDPTPADAEGLFRALTLRQVSRNRYFASFTYAVYRRVHRRYRVVRALRAEAERLAGIPGSFCRVRSGAGVLQVRLESPRLQYRREVALLPYEWEWLAEQAGIQFLLAAAAQGAESRDRLLP